MVTSKRSLLRALPTMPTDRCITPQGRARGQEKAASPSNHEDVRAIVAAAAVLVLAPAARGATLLVVPSELSARGGTAVVYGAVRVPRRVGVELARWDGKPVGWLLAPRRRRDIRLPWHGRVDGRRIADGFYHLRLVYQPRAPEPAGGRAPAATEEPKRVLAMAPVRVDSTPPRLSHITVTNDATRFAGDGTLLTTISPNGDGFRDHARIRFRLSETARVDLQVAATISALRPPRPVAMLSQWLPPGRRALVWDRSAHVHHAPHRRRPRRQPAHVRPNRAAAGC
jgi:hypothetical protein